MRLTVQLILSLPHHVRELVPALVTHVVEVVKEWRTPSQLDDMDDEDNTGKFSEAVVIGHTTKVLNCPDLGHTCVVVICPGLNHICSVYSPALVILVGCIFVVTFAYL